jgi:hypothetical protein
LGNRESANIALMAILAFRSRGDEGTVVLSGVAFLKIRALVLRCMSWGVGKIMMLSNVLFNLVNDLVVQIG